MRLQFTIKHQLSTILVVIFSLISTTSVSAHTVNKTLPNTNTLNNGLVGWWTFDGADVNKTQVLDKSSNNNGTRTAITMVPGKIGQAGSFDGTSSNVDLASNKTLSTGAWSLSLWFNSKKMPATISATDIQNFIGADGFPSRSAYLSIRGKRIAVFSGGAWSSSATDLVVNKRYHLVYTSDGNGQDVVYINGAKDSSFANLGTTDDDLIVRTIGAGYNSGTVRFFYGSIDDVRLWNRALSAKEITQLYQEGTNTINKTIATTPNLNRGLQGWWTFDGADVNATQSLDKSGFNRNVSRTGITLARGKIGQAITVGKSLTISTIASFSDASLTHSFSIWVKTKSPAALNRYVFDTQSPRLIFGWNSDSSGVIGYYDGVWHDFGTAPNDGKWHHLVWVLNSATSLGTFYQDGKSQGSLAYTGESVSSGAAGLCDGHTGGVGPFNGQCDDARLWNRALSAKEITQLYQEGLGTVVNKTLPNTYNLNSGLVDWYTFDGTDVNSTRLFDKGSNGAAGTFLYVDAAHPSIIRVPGVVGQGIKLMATTTYNFTADKNTSATANATFSFWMKEKGSKAQEVIATVEGTQLQILGNGFYFQPPGGSTESGTKTINDGKWHLIEETFDGTTSSLYFDGYLNRAIRDTSIHFSNAKTTLGYPAPTYDYLGFIDDLRVYNRALSAKEIKQLYRMGISN